jgi:squalene cyclase
MLQVAGWGQDEITEGAVEFFLSQQEMRGNWETAPARSPTVGSPFTVTFLALRALKHYGQKGQVRESMVRAENWLLNTQATDTEDRVYRLRALHLLENEAAVEAEAEALIAEQRPDGGWGQRQHLDSDAYATGTVLSALADSGALSFDAAVFRAGLRYLVNRQQADGSWFVRKRTKSIQPMFDSGVPHGQDQFISYSATCWATHAILKALPLDKRRAKTDFVSSSRKIQTRLEKMVPGN